MSANVLYMTPPDPERLAWFELNDDGNARRLAARAMGKLLFVRGKGWIAWDGRRWTFDQGEERATQLAQDVAVQIRDEVTALSKQINDGRLPPSMVNGVGAEQARKLAEEKLKALHGWAIKSGNRAQTRGMLAQAETKLVADWETFDPDPLAWNCRNGVLRFLRRGDKWISEFTVGHDPEDRITRLAEVDYDAKARCPLWTSRLDLIQPDEDQRWQLQVLIGYAMTGLTSDQQFYLNQGPGGDGKSMTWSTVTKIWGDYHRRAKVQSFLEGPNRSGADHSSDIARLGGDIRLVTASEPPKRSRWNTNLLKEATGGDKMTARALREAEIEILPHWKFVVECNGLPGVPSSDDGWWRRVRVIQWPFQFARMGVATEQPHVLQEKLLAEASGILNWAITGALSWLMDGGVPESRSSRKAASEYRRSTDPFDEWYLDWCVTRDRAASELASVLYQSFKEFSEASGLEKVMTQKTFGLKLAEKLHERHKSNGNIYRLGIRLKTSSERDASDPDDDARGVVVQAPEAFDDGSAPVGF